MPTTQVTLPFKATEKQLPFVQSSAMYRLGGGARGGGKSHTLAGIAILLSFLYPGNSGFMGRADLTDFKRTTLPLVLDLIPPELLRRHQQQEHFIDILSCDGKTTSRMWYGEMKDPSSVLSGNYGWFFIDEAYEVPEETFVNLAGTLRNDYLPNGQARPLMGLLASNPSPGWLMETFPVLEEEQQLYDDLVAKQGQNFRPVPSPYQPNPDRVKMIDPDYAYFPFRAKDNPFTGPAYEARLIKDYGRLGQAFIARMVYGVWDVTMEGLVHKLDNSTLWRGSGGKRLYREGGSVILAGDPSNGAGVYAVNVLQRWKDRVLLIDEFHRPGGTDEDFREWLNAQPYANDVEYGIFDPAKPDTIRRLNSWGIYVRGMRKKKNVSEQVNSLNLALNVDPIKGYGTILIDEVYCPETVSELRKRVYRSPSKRTPGLRISENPIKANDHHCNAIEYWFYEMMPFGQSAANKSVQEQVYQARSYMNLLR